MDSHDIELGFKVFNADVECLPQKDRNRLLEAHLDDVMVELMALKDAIDPSVSVTFSSGEVEISLTVKARSEKKAVEKADALIRTAVHAAGGFTGNWKIDWSEPATAPKGGLVDA
jgi:hypothetical protein